jgi:cellulose synthase/poly-beta-1,6-N-acetylglucosamine synthase-like glycosyltransferase
MSQDPGVIKKEMLYLAGCNCIFKKDKLIEAGLYDTSNKTNGEDTFISFKLKKLGYKLFFEPTAISYHLRKDNVFSVIRTRWGWANGKKNIKSPEVYSIFSLFFKSFVGLGWALKCLKRDLKERNFDLLYIDFFMPFYWFYYTLKKWLNYKGQEFFSIKDSLSNF